jgi:hypothetical protein
VRIGLVVSEHSNSKYLLEFCEWARTTDFAEISLINESSSQEAQKRGFLRNWLQKTIITLDERYLNWTSYRGHLQTKSRKDLAAAVSGQANNFDYLVVLDGQLVNAELLATASKGALILDAGIPTQELSFFGFWEVFTKKASTPFRIRLQTANSVENVLVGSLLTQSSFLLNQAYITRKGLYYLQQYLSNKAGRPDFAWPHLQADGEAFMTKRPSNLSLALYLGKRIVRNIQEKISNLQKKDQQWNVAFLCADWQPLALAKGTAFDVSKDQFFADPFVIHREGRDFCFVEEYDYKTGLGHISAFELDSTGAKSLGAVIKEPFHMSFPYLFEYQGELYMCPETSGSKEIRLYKCLEFPLKWQFEKAIMKNVAAVDCLLFEQSGKWWMLTNIDPLQKNDNCTELQAFYADSPLSETWMAHPLNPLVIDPLKARNGGLLRQGDKIFRVSQSQEFAVYGASSRIHEVLELSETSYSEKTIAKIKADFFEDIYGTHHLHSNGRVTVYDFCKSTKVNR